jgi:putative PEP-CTERM system histidine kinase
MHLAVAGYGTAALLYAGLCALALRAAAGRDSRGGPALLYAFALLGTAAWAAAEAASDLSRDRAWPIAAALLDLLRDAAWLGLLLELAGFARAPDGRRVAHPGLVGIAALVLLTAGLQAWHAHASPDAPSRALLFTQLALPLVGLVLVEQMLRQVGDDSRWHVKPLAAALVIVFAFDVYLVSHALMFGGIDADHRAARGVVQLLVVPVLFVGTRQRGDWIARLRVSRRAAFHSITLVLAGGYLLALSALGYYVRYFGGSWGRALQISLLTAALAALVALGVSGSLRARLRVFLDKHFFSYRFDYREEWLRFTETLDTRGSPQQVGQAVIRGLADMVDCPAGALWARVDADDAFKQAVRWNTPRSAAEEPCGSPFCRFLAERAWVVDLHEQRAAPTRYEGLVLPAWLAMLPGAWLVVPLLASDRLLGFVVLAEPRARADVNWEVLDLLKTASRQAAGQLAQMQATEALFEARKFEAFNKMSAFVVHDLKNIVTQLSLMLKNAQRLHDNREFQQDMLLTVESSLEKMRRLMLQLREGQAATGRGRGVELEPLVQRLCALARGQGREVEVGQLEPLATRGHEERLERVLGHLVQNALDATPPEGRVWLQVFRFSGQVQIEVGDTGSGMSEEFVQTRLFKPFASTKASGMGVGSYESFQYVRELGGSIKVQSQPGEGTVIDVFLPLFDRTLSSDLMPLDGA